MTIHPSHEHGLIAHMNIDDWGANRETRKAITEHHAESMP